MQDKEQVKEEFGRSAVDGGLFVLFYKRLEAGTFRVEDKEGVEEVTAVDLDLLLKGMSLRRIKFRKKAILGVFSKGVDC